MPPRRKELDGPIRARSSDELRKAVSLEQLTKESTPDSMDSWQLQDSDLSSPTSPEIIEEHPHVLIHPVIPESHSPISDTATDSTVIAVAETQASLAALESPPQNPRQHRRRSSFKEIASYGTLPKAMRKNISRSLVPKMRRMFERARSCEPGDMPQLRIHVHSDCPPRAPSSVTSDGTESVSSFVVVSSSSNPSSSLSEESPKPESAASSQSSKDLNERERSGSPSKRGFVNKCMSKVKSIISGPDDKPPDSPSD